MSKKLLPYTWTHDHEEADSQVPCTFSSASRREYANELVSRRWSSAIVVSSQDFGPPHVYVWVYITLPHWKFIQERATRSERSMCWRDSGRSIDRHSVIGVHNSTGADWGGTFVGGAKKIWITGYTSNDTPTIPSLTHSVD